MQKNNTENGYKEALTQELRPFLLDPTKNYPEPYYMLEYNGVPFSAMGGIQALSGQKKNGKTFVLVQLMAAILDCEGKGKTQDFLQGLQVPERTLEHLREKNNDPNYLPKVLYCDTEMEQLNSAKVLRRVHWLCDVNLDRPFPDDRFNVLWLRAVEDMKDENGKVIKGAYEVRFDIIKKAIDLIEPDIVFIDGIRDIIGDFNDNLASSALVSELMSLAEKKNICIWNILHFNPRPGKDSESKMRGHLGTELGNKVSDTLVSSKKREGRAVTFTVNQQDARGKDVDDWKFEITEEAGALGIPRIIENGTTLSEPKKNVASEKEISDWINTAIQKYYFPMSRKEFKEKVIGEIGGKTNTIDKQANLNAAFNYGLIEDSTLKKNGFPMVQVKLDEGDMPF